MVNSSSRKAGGKRSLKTSKKASRKPAKKRAKKPAKKPARAAHGKHRVKIRMYRQGLGDCFLVTLPGKGRRPFYIVIDCGVILGTKNPTEMMAGVVQNIIATTGGRINLLIATHEHWDHISGFIQAEALWRSLKVDEVWLGWTENSKDPLAQKLSDERRSLTKALTAAAFRLGLNGETAAAAEVASLLDFFGATGNSTRAALDVVKSLSKNVRYCRPGDAPVRLQGTEVRAYVLGPPTDERFIKKFNPSKKEPETYGLDALHAFLKGWSPALSEPDLDVGPFDLSWQIPMQAAEQMPFFQAHYWGEDEDSNERVQDWRRIDGSWLDSSSALALQLDSATNNTCLVLALELEDGDVLLFAADAQVGNWLSWQDLEWKVGARKVTGPDLLRRTIFYKVGHHGSHNATLREKGLEEMVGLQLAFIPVDHEMAVRKGWKKMPLPKLITRLNEVTSERVVRIDDDTAPAKLKSSVRSDKLFHEVTL
jgi:hypothetical protein